MMASNAELHSYICLLQFMDLSPETAWTMLASVAKCHILAVFKYKVRSQIARAIFTDRRIKPSHKCVHTNAGKRPNPDFCHYIANLL